MCAVAKGPLNHARLVSELEGAANWSVALARAGV